MPRHVQSSGIPTYGRVKVDPQRSSAFQTPLGVVDGSGIFEGRALSGLGQTIGAAGVTLSRAEVAEQERTDNIIATDVFNLSAVDIIDMVDEKMQLEGKNAQPDPTTEPNYIGPVRDDASYGVARDSQTEIKKIFERDSQGLNARQLEIYRKKIAAVALATYGQLSTHQATQKTAVEIRGRQGERDVFTRLAKNAFGNPEDVAFHLVVLDGLYDAETHLPDSMIVDAKQAKHDEVWGEVIELTAQQDWAQAHALLAEKSGEMSAEQQSATATKIDQHRISQEAPKFVLPIFEAWLDGDMTITEARSAIGNIEGVDAELEVANRALFNTMVATERKQQTDDRRETLRIIEGKVDDKVGEGEAGNPNAEADVFTIIETSDLTIADKIALAKLAADSFGGVRRPGDIDAFNDFMEEAYLNETEFRKQIFENHKTMNKDQIDVLEDIRIRLMKDDIFARDRVKNAFGVVQVTKDAINNYIRGGAAGTLKGNKLRDSIRLKERVQTAFDQWYADPANRGKSISGTEINALVEKEAMVIDVRWRADVRQFHAKVDDYSRFDYEDINSPLQIPDWAWPAVEQQLGDDAGDPNDHDDIVQAFRTVIRTNQ